MTMFWGAMAVISSTTLIGCSYSAVRSALRSRQLLDLQVRQP